MDGLVTVQTGAFTETVDGQGPSSAARSSKILLVDDNKPLRDAVAEALEVEGWGVFAVGTGKEALGLIRDVRFDAALVDLRLPDVSGVEVLKALSKRQPGVQPIIITAYPQSDLMLQADALTAGWVTVLRKPFPISLLLEILRFRS